MRLPSLSPVARLSFGLTALVISFLFLLDMIGVVSDNQDVAKQLRQRISENLAIQVALFLGQGNVPEMGRLLIEVKNRETEIQSVGVRKNDGNLLAQIGEHAGHWRPKTEERSDADNIRVPLFANKQPWGNLEVRFRSLTPTTLHDWLGNNLVTMLLVLGVGCFSAFYLFLRRALLYLDPTGVVPERVQRAYDSLREGVMILDDTGRIMLTNAAFGRLHPKVGEDLIGQDIYKQTWLFDGWAGGDPSLHPWTLALREGKTSDNLLVEMRQPDAGTTKAILNVSPVQAPSGAVRGCLISIDDVSELHRVNEQLLKTVLELNESREEIDRKNKELQMLANRDPLTGCLNRRAFFEMLEEHYVKARADGTAFCCIMTDIDHFKSFNDRYGHAVGDDVIRAVVRCLQSGLRNNDLLCRYGGEEFCIILPDVPLSQALEVGERLREAVEQHAGSSLRTSENVRVTSSFGVAELAGTMIDPAELVARADEALYYSKRNGRNRVSEWRAEAVTA